MRIQWEINKRIGTEPPTRWRAVFDRGTNRTQRKIIGDHGAVVCVVKTRRLIDGALIRAIFESKRDRFWPRRENRVGHERSAQRAREVVWTLWKMAAAPYQAQWPLRQIVYFARGGGVSRIAASHLRRRANAPLWPACDPRCQSDVSGRARSLILLPPWPPRCLPKPEVHRGPFHPPFPPARLSTLSEYAHHGSLYFSVKFSFFFSFLFSSLKLNKVFKFDEISESWDFIFFFFFFFLNW